LPYETIGRTKCSIRPPEYIGAAKLSCGDDAIVAHTWPKPRFPDVIPDVICVDPKRTIPGVPIANLYIPATDEFIGDGVVDFENNLKQVFRPKPAFDTSLKYCPIRSEFFRTQPT
jgi:hypothetical protein